MANPPFAGSLDYESTAKDLQKVVKTKKTELLFLALFLKLLKAGGRAAVIVPDGVLFGSSNAHKTLRKMLVEDQKLDAVVKLPSGVFRPYAGVSTAILFFTKTNSGGTDDVWFYDVRADGFSLDDKRNPVEANDLPDVLTRWQNLDGEANRKRTDQSFLVPKADIVAQGYDLSLNRTRKLSSIPAHDQGVPELVLGSTIGSSKQLVQPGDVMVSKIIPHIRRARIVQQDSGLRQIASGEWIVFRGSEFDPGYLKHFLLSDDFHKQFMNTVAGVGGSLVRARPAQVRGIGLPLPPLPEQRRIAAILDHADALRAKRRQVLTHLDPLTHEESMELSADSLEELLARGTSLVERRAPGGQPVSCRASRRSCRRRCPALRRGPSATRDPRRARAASGHARPRTATLGGSILRS